MTKRPHIPSASSDPAGAGDKGSVLVMALVFVTVIGLVVSALLVEVHANLKTSTVVRTKTDKTYAADTGIEYAIESLREGDPHCAEATGSQSMGSIDVDGITVDITCETTAGSATGAGGWAVVTLDNTEASLFTSSGHGKKIEGPVWSARIDNKADMIVTKGNVYEQPGANSCSSAADKPSSLTVSPYPYQYLCQSVAHGVSMPTLPTLASMTTHATGAPALVVGSCNIFTPGIYTTAPELGSDNYFVSGVYYFNNVGTFQVRQAKVAAGQPASSDETPVNTGMDSPCATDASVGMSGNGTGARLIFGGNSRLDVANQGNIELFARQGGPAWEGTQGVSIQSVPAGSTGWATSTLGLTDKIIDVSGGSTAELTIHGGVYVPNAFVDFFASNDSTAQLLGGVFAGRLQLQSSASAGGLIVSVKTGPGFRNTVITAIARGDSGERHVTAEAVVDLNNDADRTYTIESWRTE